jgi:hypothetical protein
MAVQHKRWPVYGLQFHPESFLTVVGIDILRRFLELRPIVEPVVASASVAGAADQHRASPQHALHVQTLDPSFEPIEE